MNSAALENLLLLVRIFLSPRARAVWRRLFSRIDYLESHPDVKRSLYPAGLHFAVFGNAEHRNPSRRFDTRLYLDRNPDVARCGVNALIHFSLFGEREGRAEPDRFMDGPWQPVAIELPEHRGKSVLIALPLLTFGGAESLFRTIAEVAIDEGWTPIVVTTLDPPTGMPRNSKCFEGTAARVYDLPAGFESQRERLAAVERMMEHFQVELLMLAGSEAMYHWLPRLKNRFPRLRVVDHLFNSASAHVRDNRFFAAHIDATVVQSPRVLREIRDKPAGRIVEIPLGVEIPSAIHQPGAGVVGYVGRMSAEKAPDLFVEIARRLAGRGTPAHFVLAGDGPEKRSIENLATGLDVEMPGYVSPVEPLMNRLDVLVVPSRVDGTPAAALEAQALAIPVVASKTGGLPDIVEDGETGFLCAPGDIETFCNRISELIGDVPLRKRLGAAGRERVIERHAMPAMKKRYGDLLNG